MRKCKTPGMRLVVVRFDRTQGMEIQTELPEG